MSALSAMLARRDAYLREHLLRCAILAALLIAAAGCFGFFPGSTPSFAARGQ